MFSTLFFASASSAIVPQTAKQVKLAQACIAWNDIPKIEGLTARFPQLWSDKPVA